MLYGMLEHWNCGKDEKWKNELGRKKLPILEINLLVLMLNLFTMNMNTKTNTLANGMSSMLACLVQCKYGQTDRL